MQARRTTPPLPIDLEQELPWLAGRARQTIRLHPRRSPDNFLDLSKIGGHFLWPAGEPWPHCPAGGPWPHCAKYASAYVGVLQLAAADVPQMPFPPDTDLFQLLWCPFDHPAYDYGPTAAVFWRRQSDIEDALMPPAPDAKAESNYLPHPCTLHPELVEEYPDIEELSEEEINDLHAWCETARRHVARCGWIPRDPRDQEWYDEEYEASAYYKEFFGVAPGTKIGGYAAWIQAPEIPTCVCGRPMEHLLTIDSGEFDGIGWMRWCPLEDRSEASGPAIGELCNPTGLMLGDCGALYMFVCRACTPWRISTAMQCS